MKPFSIIAGIVLVVALTVLSGVIHGRISHRWGPSHAMARAGEKLADVPKQVGPWRLEDSEKMGELALDMLQCTGYLVRSYVNQDTGQRVKVALIVGPTGPISVHTPEVCFKTRDYKITQNRRPVTVRCSDGAEHQLWALTIRSRSLRAETLRVCYAWSTGTRWAAAENPRFGFAGSPYLYKIQLAAPLPPGTDLEKNDPCQAFLQDFLPAVGPHLIETTGN